MGRREGRTVNDASARRQTAASDRFLPVEQRVEGDAERVESGEARALELVRHLVEVEGEQQEREVKQGGPGALAEGPRTAHVQEAAIDKAGEDPGEVSRTAAGSSAPKGRLIGVAAGRLEEEEQVGHIEQRGAVACVAPPGGSRTLSSRICGCRRAAEEARGGGSCHQLHILGPALEGDGGEGAHLGGRTCAHTGQLCESRQPSACLEQLSASVRRIKASVRRGRSRRLRRTSLARLSSRTLSPVHVHVQGTASCTKPSLRKRLDPLRRLAVLLAPLEDTPPDRREAVALAPALPSTVRVARAGVCGGRRLALGGLERRSARDLLRAREREGTSAPAWAAATAGGRRRRREWGDGPARERNRGQLALRGPRGEREREERVRTGSYGS